MSTQMRRRRDDSRERDREKAEGAFQATGSPIPASGTPGADVPSDSGPSVPAASPMKRRPSGGRLHNIGPAAGPGNV